MLKIGNSGKIDAGLAKNQNPKEFGPRVVGGARRTGVRTWRLAWCEGSRLEGEMQVEGRVEV